MLEALKKVEYVTLSLEHGQGSINVSHRYHDWERGRGEIVPFRTGIATRLYERQTRELGGHSGCGIMWFCSLCIGPPSLPLSL